MGCSTNIFALFLFWCFTSGLCTKYMVIVVTGYYQTSSRVEIRLVGDGGRTSAHDLSPWGGTFKRNSKNRFTIHDGDVGKLKTVELYLHSGSQWSVTKVIVISGGVSVFLYYKEIKPGSWTSINSKCPHGYQKGPSGTCIDIDECRKNPCKGPLVKCQNTFGSYRCECPRGYRVRFEQSCEDIDECLEIKPWPCDQKCENTPGSYRCYCKRGYKFKEGKCFDINECQDGSHHCDSESTYCENKEGYFSCKCKAGYKKFNVTHCQAMYCSSFTADKKTTYTPPRCTKNNANRYKDICTRGCTYGYELKDDPSLKTLTCIIEGAGVSVKWKGKFYSPPNYCIGVKCPALPAIANGRYPYRSCGITGGQHGGHMCYFLCNTGYLSVGTTTFHCQANGTWDGVPGKCKKVYPTPWITCPSKISKSLPPGKSSLSVGSDWKLPQSNYKNIAASPSGVNGRYQFPAGKTKITWTVTNAEGKTASCSNYVDIQDKEPPKITYCPGPKVFYPAYSNPPYFVKYKEPKFTDNVGVVKIKPPYSGGTSISYKGHTNLVVKALDKTGNEVQCAFTVYTGGSKCSLQPDDQGYPGTWNLGSHQGIPIATRVCPIGTSVAGIHSTWGMWYCTKSIGKWEPAKVDDCVVFTSANKTSQCTDGYEKTFRRNVYKCMQCPLGTFYLKNATGKGACAECPAGTFQNNRGSTTCNKCPVGTYSLKGDYKCRDLCPRGTFSQDSMRPFCSLCPQGQYQPKEGQTSCLNCAANKFTNTKLGSFSCQDSKPSNPQNGVLVISSIVKPKAWNTDSKGNTTLECYINDNNYKPVSVQWKVDNKGIPDDFIGKSKFEEIRNAAGKPVGARVIVTKATQHNADVDYACVAANPNGETRKTVKMPYI